MKKIIITLFLVLICLNINAQTEISEYQIPKGAEYKGKVKKAFTWNDKNGDNYFIYTVQEEIQEYPISKEIYCYHYKKKGEKILLVRMTYDFIKQCAFDLTLKVMDDSFYIYDLDNDGYMEITYVYKLSCKSDVSPDEMKLIMLENGEKYAIRGYETMLFQGGMLRGKKTVDVAFKKAPKEFLVFAQMLWGHYQLKMFR